MTSKCHNSLPLVPFRALPIPPLLVLLPPLLNSPLVVPLISLLLLPLAFCSSSVSFPPSSSSPQLISQQTRICPLKCQCSLDGSSLACSNLSRAEVRHLFASGGTPSSEQFASALLNLSIVHSQLDSLDILPPMDRLLWLDLRGNQLEKVETRRAGKSFSSFGDRLRLTSQLMSAFPALVFLDLSQNLITSISRHSFASFPNVEEIRLTANRIVSVEWEAFRLFRLRRLSLSANYLLTISEHILRFSPAIEQLDLSHNLLSSAQSSSFFAAQHLRFLNLSYNRLHKFDYDSFSPLFQLESLDISWNNFSAIPPDIRQFVALRELNFSGNPIEKVAEGELAQPMLQTLQICDCPRLRLVERKAFAALPNLQFLRLANNQKLQFVSPGAFLNNSLLFEVDFSNNSLSAVSPRLLLLPVRLHLRANPLFCGCISDWLPNVFRKLAYPNESICISSVEGQKERQIPMANFVEERQNERQKTEGCPREPILPMGKEFRAKVGEFFSMYCAPRIDGNGEQKGGVGQTLWTLPNGTELIGDEERVHAEYGERNGDQRGRRNASGNTRDASYAKNPIGVRSSSAHSLPPSPLRSPSLLLSSPFLGSVHPSLFTQQIRHPSASLPNSLETAAPQPRARIQAEGEQLRFEVLVSEDAGNYTCRVNGTGVALRLSVETPVVRLSAIEIGSHYVALVWNDSLKIRAAERVQLSLEVRDAATQQRRTIQLSLHNPWHSYNVVRLRPLTNYSFCLQYHLVLSPLRLSESLLSIFKTCVDVRTEAQLGFWSSLSPTSVGVLFAFCFCLCALLCFRALYLRFYIWHEAKLRARMNQSMSGQSFLSHSSSLHHSVHQQLNSAQSASAVGTRPSDSSSSYSNFVSNWEGRCSSTGESLQRTDQNEKRMRKRRKEKTTALRPGKRKSTENNARRDGDGGGIDMTESIVLC